MKSEIMKSTSIEVGDYGYIKCSNSNYTGWYMRVKLDGKVMYVNKKDTSFMIPDTYIASGSNVDYVLVYKVNAIEVMNGYDFKEITPDELEKLNLIYPIKEKIQILWAEISNLRTAIINKSEELTSLKLELYNIENGKSIVYQYVYGVHDTNNNEFCWINDRHISVNVGDEIEVETGFGIKKAVVTRIENSEEYKKHKPIIRKIN